MKKAWKNKNFAFEIGKLKEPSEASLDFGSETLKNIDIHN
jgi:hypothetical protein